MSSTAPPLPSDAPSPSVAVAVGSVSPESSDENNDKDAVTASSLPSSQDVSPFIQTVAGNNWVSRTAVIENARHVELKGRCVVHDRTVWTARGSGSWIRTGRYCHVQQGTTVTTAPLPQWHTTTIPEPKGPAYVPVTIGSHTVIGKECCLQAAAVGSYCWIGNNVTLGPRSIVRDCCVIADNVVVPDDTVVPPFTRVSTAAAAVAVDTNVTLVGTETTAATAAVHGRLIYRELPPSTAQEMQERSMELYQEFVAEQQQQQRKMASA